MDLASITDSPLGIVAAAMCMIYVFLANREMSNLRHRIESLEAKHLEHE